jgi:hypothetical protein
MAIPPWTYPDWRYYYGWFGHEPKPPVAEPNDQEPDELAERDALRSDGDIKSTVVERLKTNIYTTDEDIRVDVKQRVVVLGGEVDSWVAKRAAGDDAWDTPGVVDVSNRLRTRETAAEPG